MEQYALSGKSGTGPSLEYRASSSDNASGFALLVHPHGDGSFSLSLLLSGLHCAACIHKVESGMMQEPAMMAARVNFSTGKLVLRWKGEAALANHYVSALEAMGYGVRPFSTSAEARKVDEEERTLLGCVGISGFAMGNIMLLSVGLWTTDMEGMGEAMRTFLHWISALIALPTLLYSARPFYTSAYTALRAGRTNMDMPITVGVLLTSGMSLFETINYGEHAYFDSVVMLVFFLLIGRYLDFKARRNTRSAASDLLRALEGFASVINNDGSFRQVPVSLLQEEDKVRVMAGEKFPADGEIISGTSSIDTSLATGETLPRPARIGTPVYAGTINLDAPVTVRICKTADRSMVAEIARLMETAAQGQSQYVRLADRLARLYTPVVHILALAGFLGWFYLGGVVWQEALMIAATILIITCPCALGLAVPVVQVLAAGKLMRKGIYLKSGDALERLAQIDTLAMDKTGTLTLGNPVLISEHSPDHLRLAAALAMHSRHPLAQALYRAAGSFDAPMLEDITETAGQGLEARIGKTELRLGRASWCGITSQDDVDSYSHLWFREGEQDPVKFLFEDRPRPDALDVVKAMKADGVRILLISGDRTLAVEKAARICGIDEWLAEKTPSDKYYLLKELEKQGRVIGMVGDGLNDAPALAGAFVSIAPGTAADISQNAADIVFIGSRLSPVLEVYRLARTSKNLIRQNFALALIYNIIAVPAAFAGIITPLIAAAAMSLSSLVVIANSFRLKRA